MRTTWIRHTLMMFLIASGLLVLSERQSEAGMRGEVDLSYLDYSATGADDYSADISSFTQRYAFAYSMDSMSKSRKNKNIEYNFLLGYEWLSFNTKAKGSELLEEGRSASSGRPIFLGDISYDPPALPVKLNVYSYDLTRPSFEKRDILGGTLSSVLYTPVANDFSASGTNIKSGATLLVGVKDSYKSRYAEIFNQLPLFMLDYKSTITKSDNIANPVDSRLSELAFVSLNKKDNWFHIRNISYDNKIHPGDSWNLREYQLGTVDEKKARTWIDLTNWIRISADGQLAAKKAQNSVDSYEEYTLNLFTVATRRTWELRNFTTVSRLNDFYGLTTERSIPFYLRGTAGRELNWSAFTSFHDKQVITWDGLKTNESSRSAGIRASLFERSSFSLTPSLKIATTDNSTVRSIDAKFALDSASTRRFSLNTNISLRYELDGHFTDAPSAVGDDFIEQQAYVNFQYAGGRFRVNLRQNLAHAFTLNDESLADKDYIRSFSEIGLGWGYSTNLDISLSARQEYSDYTYKGTDTLRAASAHISYRLSSVLRSAVRAEITEAKRADGFDRTSLNIDSSLEYTPSRNLFTSFRYRDASVRENGLKTPSREINQLFRYSWNPGFVMSRKLIEIEEEFKRTQNSYDTATSTIRVGARYYPFSKLSLTGNMTKYTSGYDQYDYNLGANFDFRLLQASLNYAYGKRTNDQRVEKRIMANVRRSF